MEAEAFGRYPVVGGVVFVKVDIHGVAEGIGDRPAQQKLDRVTAQIAGLEPDIALELIARIPGHVIDGATESRAAECRALRASEDLDTLDTRQLQRSLRADYRQTVNEGRDLLT